MVGTVEDALVRKQRDPDGIGPIDKLMGIGETCRLEIPFRDVIRMRQTAQLLRGFADMLESYSHRTDLPQRAVLVTLQMEAKMLNRKIKGTRGAGRPKKVYDSNDDPL